MATREQAGWRSVSWQAHQNSNSEMPENTMAAVTYAWELGGIPELDIRQTADGTIVGLHDATPGRTTDAPEADKDKEISTLTFEQLQVWDAGIRFGEPFRGERIPALAHILAVLAEHPERELYLDYKQVDLGALAGLIRRYGVGSQIIFAHNDYNNCCTVKELLPDVRTMLWVSGRVPEAAMRKFEEMAEADFASLDIIQLHLVNAEEDQAEAGWNYRLPRPFLASALQRLQEKGRELEVLPFYFDDASLFDLLDLGIRRFAVDEPKVFVESLQRYF
ncbi:glycerophosphodiester phosphodiesterase family protein [Paenibacillus oryzisoli]|uniref:glycerophosphodiester phosphodiesterase n=1 Tax=Paenibacillus oryzisoli TaxID=1850517 RepID=UPI003D2AEF57